MIIITGQTATGKTKLALEYAKKYNGELINCDSRQIYKYLDIITGKDLSPRVSSRAERSGVEGSVWLYDFIKPYKYFSSFDYVKAVQNIIKDVKKRRKTPILVGGSYFYLKHLLYGFDTKVPPNFRLREKLNNKTVEKLHNILKKLNVKSFNQMNNSDRNNPRRLIRKIEIEKAAKKTGVEGKGIPDGLPAGRQARSREVLFEASTDGNEPETGPVFLMIGLRYKNKEKLREAIKTRVEKRLKQGAIKEVELLLKKGYQKTDPGLKTIGYQQIIDYLEGNTTKKQAIEKWITAEVQYAKRQYTFMKKDKNIKWRLIS